MRSGKAILLSIVLFSSLPMVLAQEGGGLPPSTAATTAPTAAPAAARAPTPTAPVPGTTTAPATTTSPGTPAVPTPGAPAGEPTAGTAPAISPVGTAGVATPPGTQAAAAPTEEMVYLNVQDGEIKDIIKQISKATGRNFIIDDKIKGKITIISEKPMTKEEAYQTFLSALEVTGFTVVKGPAGILKIVPLRDAVQKPIPTHVDTTPMTDSYVTRLIKLNNISALDMANAIKPLISKDGNLFAYPATNTMILTDSGSNIDRLMKIIKELDQEGPQQVLEIIRVSNATAKDIAQMVNSLFEQSKEGKPRPKAGEPEEIAEVSKIIPDERTNSIIVLASKRAIVKVREIIARLDARLAEGQEGKIHVYYLKYAKAKTLAETLNNLTSGAGKPAAGGAAGGAPKIAELEGGVKVGYDESTNSLLVTSSAKDFKTLIERVISKLDVQRRQVYLEAVVMELRMNKGRNLGVAAHGGGGGNVIGFGQSFGALPQLQSTFLSGGASAPALLGGLISSRTVGVNVINPSDGTQKTVTIPAFSAFLSALSSYGDTNIVSTPNLLTLDNEEATIEVRSEEPIPGQQTIQANVAIAAPPTYEKAGLLMKIKPQIGYGDTVNLNIEQELSNFGPTRTINGNPVPSRIKRNVKTVVVCQDGQTVVLGGLMEDQLRNSKTKVPILGDIPILGLLFQSTTKLADKTNLLIFITPHIVKDATDFSEILKRKIDERNRFIHTNYGKRQQEIIRESIKMHREDLLEYKEGGAAETTQPSPVMTPSPAPPSTQTKQTVPPVWPEGGLGVPAKALPPAQAAVKPVITTPPISSGGYGAETIPLAPGVGIQPSAQPPAKGKKGFKVEGVIPEGPYIESSATKPVEKPVWMKSSAALPSAPVYTPPSAILPPVPSTKMPQIPAGAQEGPAPVAPEPVKKGKAKEAAALPPQYGQPPAPMPSTKMPQIPAGAELPEVPPIKPGAVPPAPAAKEPVQKGKAKAEVVAPVITAKPVPPVTKPEEPKPTGLAPVQQQRPGTWTKIQNGSHAPAPESRKDGLKLGY